MRAIHAEGNVRWVLSGDCSLVLESPDVTIRYDETAADLVGTQP